jgi:long-chain acyl-CoA synthetase
MLLNELLEQTTRRYPSKIALVCKNQRYTYTDINQAADSLANALIAQGFQRYEPVIIYLDNSDETVISLYGILKAGGIFVIVNSKVKPRKLAYILLDCRAKTLITDTSHYKQLSQGGEDFAGLRRIVFTDYEKAGNLEPLSPGFKLLSFKDMVRDHKPGIIRPANIDVDLASLIYTSGSSGNPKGVMLTHLNMVTAVNSITQYLENTDSDIIMDTLPLSFDYGLYQVLMAFKFGGTVILENGFIFPEQIIKKVIQERVTGWPVVPTIAAMLCRLKNLENNDFSRLRYITSTGQVLPTNHIARLRQAFPVTKIFSMYGLTECKRVSYLPPRDLDRKPNSVGIAIPNTEVYIADDAGKEITEPGKPGELVVRGSTVMQGYWGLPEETKRALRTGSYPGEKVLYTGDLFKKDEEGYLYFLGRKDDIIKTSGHMVSPKEVENVLCEMEDIVEAAVIGVEDEILGRAIKAFVCLAEDSKATEKEIIAFCLKNLEDHAVPKYVSIQTSLPRTDSGKIQKRDLH